MAALEYVGESNKYHLNDDKTKKPLVAGQEVDITVKRAESANKKHGEIFKRIEKGD